jgi:hypothetical protein
MMLGGARRSSASRCTPASMGARNTADVRGGIGSSPNVTAPLRGATRTSAGTDVR